MFSQPSTSQSFGSFGFNAQPFGSSQQQQQPQQQQQQQQQPQQQQNSSSLFALPAGSTSTSTGPLTTPSTSFGTSFNLNTNNSTATSGAAAKPLFSFAQPTSSSSAQQQQQQPQQPFNTTNTTTTAANGDSRPSLQPLDSFFSKSDASAPHFIIQADKVTRTSTPPSFFVNARSATRDLALPERRSEFTRSSSITSMYGGKPVYLPGFLTNDAESSEQTGQKRHNKSNTDAERRVMLKTSTDAPGLFGKGSGNTGFGWRDTKGKTKANDKSIDTIPTQSLSDTDISLPTKDISTVLTDLRQPKEVTASSEAKSLGDNGKREESKPAASTSTTVNIFGFPANMKQSILEYFGQYGQIIETRQSPGNWITIRYATALAAQKAVENNGKIIAQGCMLGATLATDTEEQKSQQHGVVPLKNAIDLYKKLDTTPSFGLGSGKAGASAIGATSSVMPSGAVEKSSERGWMNKVKEVVFGW
ncbi:uncharacterized protein BYT42DRAFT_55545 [Radiomyces spectabilis]|uniref:uncharacterized protein n=1 Tax=Radiomyces spectabilis TaxID=64574 RepID=UPI00221E3D12|nr:uncharacterized protein BYT42DRAFT_55545 [Radiomyces spectabilis]KAI8373014.1 hypothetical protein BYT42DRAFT_55545 [Radiomyces spectabilis]